MPRWAEALLVGLLVLGLAGVVLIGARAENPLAPTGPSKVRRQLPSPTVPEAGGASARLDPATTTPLATDSVPSTTIAEQAVAVTSPSPPAAAFSSTSLPVQQEITLAGPETTNAVAGLRRCSRVGDSISAVVVVFNNGETPRTLAVDVDLSDDGTVVTRGRSIARQVAPGEGRFVEILLDLPSREAVDRRCHVEVSAVAE